MSTMTTTATGTVESKEWTEAPPYSEVEGGPKLSSVSGSDLYHGDFEGEAIWHGINITAADGSGTFRSLQRLVGKLGDRSGSFILDTEGTFGEAGSKGTWNVVPGSGTGDLTSLRGEGGFTYDGATYTYTLSYTLA